MAFVKKHPPATPTAAEEPLHTADSLIAQLTDPDPAQRRWAARDLVRYPDAAAALVQQLEGESDMAVREVIFTSLTRLGGAVAVAGLVDCLRSEDPAMRNEAILAMKVLPDEVAPIMGGLLQDADSDVRIMAVNVLESLQHPDVEAWLLQVIEQDPVVNVCGAAVDLLTEVGTAAALGALQRIKLRFADEPYIQFAASLALKRIVPS
jgi:HEAT repeat protein